MVKKMKGGLFGFFEGAPAPGLATGSTLAQEQAAAAAAAKKAQDEKDAAASNPNQGSYNPFAGWFSLSKPANQVGGRKRKSGKKAKKSSKRKTAHKKK